MRYKMENWYVIRTSYGNEEAIKELLELHGFAVKLLWREFFFKRQGKTVKMKKPLYPDYLFIVSELDYVSLQNQLIMIKSQCSKPFSIIEYKDRTVPALTESEIEYIKHLCGEEDIVKVSEGYIEGDKVIITEGPLLGLESTIVHVNRHKRIARITMDILGGQREIVVPLEIIYKR